jgi:transposase
LLQEDFITKLIDIQDAVIENVQLDGLHIHIHLSLKRKPHTCPLCGALTQNVHDYRIQKIKDLPIHGKHVILHYRKRRYQCACCSKRFYEKLHILTKRHRITSRSALYAIDSLRERRSIKDTANALGVSSSSVSRWLRFVRFPVPKTLPRVLSIDEFKGNASGEKYQCILTDLKQRRIFDVLPTRKQEELFAYFAYFQDKTSVKYIVMDMNRAYLEVARAYFPSAVVVIDKFHVARYCTWAFENVRKRVQKKLPAYERKYFKRSRKLLLARMKSLSDENKLAVERMLSYSADLTNAYILKEYFYEFRLQKISFRLKISLNGFVFRRAWPRSASSSGV